MSATSYNYYSYDYQRSYDYEQQQQQHQQQQQQQQQQYYHVQQLYQSTPNSYTTVPVTSINTNEQNLQQQQQPYQHQNYHQQSQEQFFQIQQPTNSANPQSININASKGHHSQEQNYKIQQPVNNLNTAQPTNTNKSIIETTLLAIKQEICQICSSPISVGLHFGAVTCEACKKFFIRCCEKKSDYSPVCKRKTGNCVITTENRSCYRCRLDKCIKVGMDIESLLLKISF